MRIAAKPKSSPGRTEKPPPLQTLKFLRTNTIARSRGRSRASRIFLRKKNNNSSSIDTQAEPSSPKVTCTGKVQPSKPHSGRQKKPPARFPCSSCSWANVNALFRTRLAKGPRPRSVRLVWGKCQWFSPFGYCRRRRKSKDGSPDMESDRNDEYEGDEDNEEEEEDEDELREGLPIDGFDYCSPPRDALLLTRCRSAPYKSTSLASRFWGQETGENRREGEEFFLERETRFGDLIPESRTGGIIEGNLGDFGEVEGLVSDGGMKKVETGEGRDWVLTRCKSEPARSGKRLLHVFD